MTVSSAHPLLGAIDWDQLGIALKLPDGNLVGSSDAPTTLIIHDEGAIAHLAASPGELGFARAYVSGLLDFEGDLGRLIDVRHELLGSLDWKQLRTLIGSAADLRRSVPPIPSVEFAGGGRFRSLGRDRRAIEHHYEIPPEFFELFLGRTMAYTTAVYTDESATLDQAQDEKHDLVCRKVQLSESDRLLDIGCGWGGFLIHAAKTYGTKGLGVTLSRAQHDYAERWAKEEGVEDLVEIRVQDYRDLEHESFDVITAIGVYEHIGLASRGPTFFDHLNPLLTDGGRVMIHAVSGRSGHDGRVNQRGFIHRYVFPDGETNEVGKTVSAMQAAGLEVHNVESLRDHYTRTLRDWTAGLNENWDAAVEVAGIEIARVWSLYLPAYEWYMRNNRIQHHQTLAVKASPGDSGFPLRPNW